ncbi:hypothetical protein ACFV4I_10945 [Nocardiopsis alba]|uniref:TPR repeat region-containing protein n=1 Tax=Nocardiopsis alba TaxID=53437 RepID=UPI0033E7572C
MSISGMKLGLPDDIEADVGGIRGKCGTLDRLCSTMMGRADDLEGNFNDAASHFTDAVAWDIQGATTTEIAKWEEAGAALTNGAAILRLWADDIETYRETRGELEERWENEKSSAQSKVDNPWHYSLGRSAIIVDVLRDGRSDREAEQIEKLEDIRRTLLEEHDTAWELLMDRAEQVEKDLKDGPSPETYQRILNAGHLGWRHLGIFVPEEGPPLTEEQGDEAAEELEKYLQDPDGYEGNISEVLAMLTLVTSSGAAAVRSGEKPPEDYMDFLEAFYERLDGSLVNHEGPRGVLGVVDFLDGNDDLDQELALGFLSEMGDGILLLSDDSVGGGWPRLPDSIQMAASGPQLVPDEMAMEAGYSFYDQNIWGQDVAALNRLLGGGSSDLQAGQHLSASLALSLGNAAEAHGGSGPWMEDEDLLGLIDVSARNEDAMHKIFTGEYEHPFLHDGDGNFKEHIAFEDNDDFINTALAGLYGNDWEGEDAAIAKMTDWISEEAWDDDPDKRERAAEAAAGVIDRLTSQEVYEAVSGVGDLDVTDDDFDPDDVASSFTELNSEIASSLTGIYESYIESFAGENGFEDGSLDLSDPSAADAAWDDDKGVFQIGVGDRLVFMEYLVGDSESAERVVTATEVYGEVQMQRHMEGGNSEQAAWNSARLQGLLDTAFSNEAISRGLEVEDAQEKKEEVYERVAGLGGDALGMVPKVGTALSYGADYISGEIIDGIFEDYVVTTSKGSDYTSEAAMLNSSRTAVLERVMEGSGGNFPTESSGTTDMSAQEARDVLVEEGVVVEENGSFSVERDSGKWDSGKADSNVAAALNIVLNGAEVDWVEGHPETGEGASVNGTPAHEFANDYVGSQHPAYLDVDNMLEFGRENMKDLYNRK